MPSTMEGETERGPLREEEWEVGRSGGGRGGGGGQKEWFPWLSKCRKSGGMLLWRFGTVPPGSHAHAARERRRHCEARSKVVEGVVYIGGDRFASTVHVEGGARSVQMATNIRRIAVEDGAAQVQRGWDVLESVHGIMHVDIARPAPDFRRIVPTGGTEREQLGMGHREGAEDYVL